MMPDRALFVGPGRAGLALGHALWKSGALESLTYCGRRPELPAYLLFVQGHARYCFGLEAETVAALRDLLEVEVEAGT